MTASPTRLTAVLPALLALAATALPARAERLGLEYQVHIGGATVMEVQAQLSLSAGRYAVEIRGATQGMLGRLASWTTHSTVTGSIAPTGPRPARYQVAASWRGEPRNVRMEYDGRGGVDAVAEPTPQKEGREPVPESLQRDTLDPLSTHLGVLLAVGRGESCARTLPVYDGRRRYDLTFADAGQEALAAGSHSVFAGTARHCRVQSRTVAGRKLQEGFSFFQRNEDDRPPLDVWIAPVRPGGPALPVRLETDSTFGGVLVHLTKVAVLPETAEKP